MDFLKSLVPLIGTALGGPLGGAAATFVASKLGLQESTIEAVSDVLNSGKMTPEQIEQLKLAELEFQKFLAQNKIDLAKMDLDNVKDARDMQKTTRASTPAVLSYGVTMGFFGILSAMLIYDYKPTEPLLIMLGALGAAFGAVVNFWLGSSHGSQVKSEMLAK
jgi:gas vesicle protein